MMPILDRLCNWLITDTKSEIEYNRVKTLITTSILFAVIHSINMVFVFSTQSPDEFNTLTVIIVYFVLLIPIVPIWFGKNSIAIFLFNTILPFFLFLVGVLLGNTYGVEYTLIPFILISFFFYDKFKYRLLLSIYYLALFFCIKFGANYFEIDIRTINDTNSFFVTNSIYVATFITIFIICQYFLSQINKYRSTTDKLLDSLSEKNLQLESAYTEMERFTYVASHDIKTPLRNISSFVGLMERDFEKGDLNQVPEYIEYIKTSAQNLFFLVGDILEYSKLNSRPDEAIKPIDLNMLTESVKKEVEVLNGNSHIEFENLPTIKANPTLFRLLFQNFIENGLKYNKSAKPKVSIKAEFFDEYLKLQFTDNGIGISEKYYNSIFEMFKRLHSNAQYQGTGIGLAICKKIVDQLSGKININSKEGIGTTFSILFPLKEIEIVDSNLMINKATR